MTNREKRHRSVDELIEDEGALARLRREREAVRQWAQAADANADDACTVGGVATEVALGPSDGMPVACAVSLDNLRTVRDADHCTPTLASRRSPAPAGGGQYAAIMSR